MRAIRLCECARTLIDMSQREDLIRGARQCIADKGYARTTARDITAASGANLASIGYYFGSKDALLNAAVLEAFDEWGDAVEEAMTDLPEDPPLTRLECFLESFAASLPARRATLAASVQAMAQAEHSDDIRQQIAASHDEGARSLAALVLNVSPEVIGDEDRAVGSFVLSLLNGFALQWYISPDTAPSAADLATTVKRLIPSGG